jgi:hypothetical protein
LAGSTPGIALQSLQSSTTPVESVCGIFTLRGCPRWAQRVASTGSWWCVVADPALDRDVVVVLGGSVVADPALDCEDVAGDTGLLVCFGGGDGTRTPVLPTPVVCSSTDRLVGSISLACC